MKSNGKDSSNHDPVTNQFVRMKLPAVIFCLSIMITLGCSKDESGPPIAPEQDAIAKYLSEHPEEAVNEEAPADESDSQE